MNQLISFVESKLVWFVIFVAGLGLAIPETGQFLEPGIGPLLAFLMFIISLTFDAHDVRTVLRKPSRQFLALGLVYGPMSIAGWLTGRFFLEVAHWLRGKPYLALCQPMSPPPFWY
ncbi:MAG: hypothetical protein V7667_01365 [Alloalcanivorax venustensis]|jgi:bile acid:Na+ symporter, BASS family|uniref:hypothetical protein n=1 Tax=Alloalcanivorax venustensis TaxID=172371 RepID=UPI003003564B|tara:strand:+ start:107 stop:454 length:348 start_codon:yes stop_codon:yes gene_type:complete